MACPRTIGCRCRYLSAATRRGADLSIRGPTSVVMVSLFLYPVFREPVLERTPTAIRRLFGRRPGRPFRPPRWSGEAGCTRGPPARQAYFSRKSGSGVFSLPRALGSDFEGNAPLGDNSTSQGHEAQKTGRQPSIQGRRAPGSGLFTAAAPAPRTLQLPGGAGTDCAMRAS